MIAGRTPDGKVLEGDMFGSANETKSSLGFSEVPGGADPVSLRNRELGLILWNKMRVCQLSTAI